MPITCPECKRPIKDDDALLCLYCGASLRRPVGLLGGMRYRPATLVLATAILLVILAFILIML
ncbi:MAG: hypothetical protein ACM3L6_03905 [Deltaproteobacteria bacterium]